EVFVTLHLADELRAPGTEAGDHGVDVVDRECDVPDTRGVRWGVSVAVRALRCMELHEFEGDRGRPGPQPSRSQPGCPRAHHAVHPSALDQPAALQLESEVDEKCRRGGEVFHHDAHVIHSLDRNASNDSERPPLPLHYPRPWISTTVGRSSHICETTPA